MGKKPDVIEQEIKEKRTAISNRLERMTNRGAEDVREVGARIENFFEEKRIAPTAREHPFATLAGALGLGIALGMASGSVHTSRGSQEYSPPEPQRYRSRADVASAGFLASILAPLEAAAVDQGTELIREWFAPARKGDGLRETASARRADGSSLAL